MVTSACFSCRIWKFSPGDKIFQVVAQSLSSRAEILDGSFLQPHILLPPPLFPSYHRISSTSSSAASLHPALAGIAVEPAAYPPKNTTHRLRHPPSRATFFLLFHFLLLLFFSLLLSCRVRAPYSKNFRTYESRIKHTKPARR